MTDLIHIEQTDLSDFYKEAWGIRPRGVYKEWWTKDELEAEYQHLGDICTQNRICERNAEKQALIEFKQLIQKTIQLGAGDRETAIKWLVQAEGLEFNSYDLEYFFWGYGLSYRLQKTWTKALTSNN
jgi:hypothetical protein